MKIETIRFASCNEDEAYFYRMMHHLAVGCLQLNAKDDAVTALVEVVSRMIGERRKGSE